MWSITSCFKSAYNTIFPSSEGINCSKFIRQEGFWSNSSDEKISGLFTKLVDPKSQRENWYAVTPYIAEFWCTLSNVGFIYVGLQQKSPELLFAGVASCAVHSIPKQWLLTVDKIGVLLVLTKLVREREVIQQNPWLIGAAATAGIINAADAYLARNYGYTWPHVVWHLSSAALADLFLRHTKIGLLQHQ